MIRSILPLALLSAQLLPAQPQVQPPVKTTAEEVLLDLVVRDKKGKPVTDLKPEEITVLDAGNKQTLTSFRLVRGAEAVNPTGAAVALDPMAQIRLVTLAFEPLGEIDQRKLARTAALDLVKGEQGTNVFFSVVAINTRLLVIQQFTNDKAAISQAIDRVTAGLGGPQLMSESDRIMAELKRNLAGQQVNGANQDVNLRAAAAQNAGQPVASGDAALQQRLASVMLDMLRMDSAAQTQGTRLTISALKSLAQGLQTMPGRKSVIYFTQGLYVTPELDVPFRNVMSLANRANVSFYSVDARGVQTSAQNTAATSELNSAAAESRTTITRTGGAVSKGEIMASDTAELSARANLQLAARDLADSTGGFLIGDSNDLRTPLHRVNEEINSYYEVSFNPAIENYDGSFHKLTVNTTRKDVVIHARNGYFALPPEARAAGIQTFELPLLKALSEGRISNDVNFRAGAIQLQPKKEGSEVALLVELPLQSLQPAPAPAKNMLDVHCSLAALVKNSSGEVVERFTRDRSLQVTPEQLKLGNFIDKTTVTLPPGKYTLESAVMDRGSAKIGTAHSEFTVAAPPKGVAISSLVAMRAYTPNAKGLDRNEPFQFQGGSITPTLDPTVRKVPNSVLRLFFTVYPDASISAKPAVEIEFLLNGKTLTKVPMELPAPDAQGRIPYLMSIPADPIPPGTYEIRATAHQGASNSQASTTVRIEAN